MPEIDIPVADTHKIVAWAISKQGKRCRDLLTRTDGSTSLGAGVWLVDSSPLVIRPSYPPTRRYLGEVLGRERYTRGVVCTAEHLIEMVAAGVVEDQPKIS